MLLPSTTELGSVGATSPGIPLMSRFSLEAHSREALLTLAGTQVDLLEYSDYPKSNR